MPHTVVVPEVEGWDSENQLFVILQPETSFVIEHSLLSISKWEEETEKSFFDTKSFTSEELILYIKCMTVGKIDSEVYNHLSSDNIRDIRTYMDRPMSALKLASQKKKQVRRLGEQMTSDTIYYQMFTLGIDKSCEKWHINRLVKLIEYMSRKNEEAYNPKKSRRLTSSEIARRDEINNARKKALNTHG